MEAAWILAGILWGGVVGYLAGLRASGGKTPETLDRRTRDEIEGLRLEWQDTLDRIEHLYDRVRKRAKVVEAEANPAAAPDGEIRSPKARARQKAKEAGLLASTTRGTG